MIRLRALLFNTLFYAVLIGYMLTVPVLAFMPWRRALRVAQHLMRTLLALQRLFGVTVELRGREHLPPGGGIIAAKHQSMWETLAIGSFVGTPAFVYKRELDRVPLFGYYLRKFRMIAIDRKGGGAAMRRMAEDTRRAIDVEGQQVIIFPEGTRRAPGAPPAYKFGVALLYSEVGRPVVPVALNSGLFWSAYAWRGHRGRIVIEVLPPIGPGLSSKAFLAELERVLEEASDRLLVESARRPDAPPLPASAQARLAALGAVPPQPSPAA